MAIRDLLWVCPLCHGALEPRGRGDRCAACGASFARGRGDRIIARRSTGEEMIRPAAAWLDTLPSPVPADGPVVAGPERVRVKLAADQVKPVFHRRELIGWVECFGKPAQGSLSLDQEALTFAVEGWGRSVPLEQLTAIQPSSSSLQLRTSNGTVASVRFMESSVLRWEILLQEAVRRRWTALGRGRVIEFQPRIACR